SGVGLAREILCKGLEMVSTKNRWTPCREQEGSGRCVGQTLTDGPSMPHIRSLPAALALRLDNGLAINSRMDRSTLNALGRRPLS
ncbi:hypothetical protein KZ868_12530, partial [Pseudomonas aeruginosa]|uniref:hypothetical protein n=1 Tax=Pseudomonas aeruginosa TaxID=287 RepID=UPI001CA514AD